MVYYILYAKQIRHINLQFYIDGNCLCSFLYEQIPKLLFWCKTRNNDWSALTLLVLLSSVSDLEKNDGSASRPYYMGSSLRAILNKKNHRRPEEKRRGGKRDRKGH